MKSYPLRINDEAMTKLKALAKFQGISVNSLLWTLIDHYLDTTNIEQLVEDKIQRIDSERDAEVARLKALLEDK